MTPLKLQKRDDPLAVGPQEPPAPSVAAPPLVEAPPVHEQPEVRLAETRARRSSQPKAARSAPIEPELGERHVYDNDRLEQTGWRLYESLLARVRDRAQELSDAGIPTSAAALAAATLHSHLPSSVQDGTELMRVYRRASAGRPHAKRNA